MARKRTNISIDPKLHNIANTRTAHRELTRGVCGAYPRRMTPPEVCKEVGDRIVPQLQELGLVSFLLVGYAEDGNGKVAKVTLTLPGDNPAYADGLRNMNAFAERWGRGEI